MLARGTTMAEPAEEIVGRAAELGSLDDALAGLVRGSSHLLALAGEPGIGKTRLLAELGARADARGHLVLAGSASEMEQDLPFGVFVDALDEYVRGLEPRRLARLDVDVRAELTEVLPSLPGASGTVATLQVERYRTHRAVRTLLETLAATKPLVLLLDDVHWADSGSIELLGALLRRLPAAPVLIALAFRPRQLPDRLAVALDRAQRAGTAARLDVSVLGDEAARELLGGGLSAVETDTLVEESGGNPLYLQELARSTRRGGDGAGATAQVALGGVEVPQRVAIALAEELSLLDPTGRLVLQGGAVAGEPFELELAAAAASLPEPTALEALDGLLARDLVRPTDVPRRFRFRHPLVRRAVYEATPGGWRLAAHERAEAALATRGAPAAARAHHAEQAGRHGDADAIAVLREAAEAVAQRTPAGAARWFSAALRLLPDAAPPGERIGLLMGLAGAEAATGRFAEAHAALLECLRAAPADAAAVRVPLISACAAVEQALGRHDEARARLEAAVADLPDEPSLEIAGLMVDLAVAAAYAIDYERAREWGDRALAVARPVGARPVAAAAAAVCGLALTLAAAIDEADRYRAEAVDLVDAMPDAELATRLDAVAHLASTEGYLDRYEQAVAHARRGFAVARATGQGHLFPVLMPAINTPLCGLGRFAEARELLEGAIEGGRLGGHPQPLAWSLQGMGVVRMLAGDIDGALSAAAESVALCREIDETIVSTYCGVMEGNILIEAGLPEQGVAMLVQSGGGSGLERLAGGWRAWHLDFLTRGWLALGRPAEARRAAAEAEAVAARTGLLLAVVPARRAKARVELDGGDPGRAAEHALASVRGRREPGRAHRGGAVAHAGRRGPGGGRGRGGRGRASGARRRDTRRARRAAIPRRRRAGARQAWPPPAPPDAAGQAGCGRVRLAHRARAAGRAAHRRPQDEPADRR
jgi:tetratricopeptide (TPR) repeat protein